MSEPTLGRRIIAGETGLWSAPIRTGLRAFEGLYGAIIHTRNQSFDRGEGVHRVDVPVISVGNITVGGTGKTPLVVHIVSRLEQMGFTPAVVARGYGARDGAPNDEERLIRSHVPGVTYVVDTNRVAGAALAMNKYGADVIVLDDGFQHRRLARDLDVVLIDATCPFGFDHLLPRGLLREPVESLTRAHVVIITRCDQVPAHQIHSIASRINSVRADLPLIRSHHGVTGIERLSGEPVDEPINGLRAVAFAGIGRPHAFLSTLASIGIEVVGHRWWPDHHDYTARDVDQLSRRDRFPLHDVLVTTEKDAVKLHRLSIRRAHDVLVVRVAVDFTEDGGTILDAMLARAVEAKRQPMKSRPES